MIWLTGLTRDNTGLKIIINFSIDQAANIAISSPNANADLFFLS